MGFRRLKLRLLKWLVKKLIKICNRKDNVTIIFKEKNKKNYMFSESFRNLTPEMIEKLFNESLLIDYKL